MLEYIHLVLNDIRFFKFSENTVNDRTDSPCERHAVVFKEDDPSSPTHQQGILLPVFFLRTKQIHLKKLSVHKTLGQTKKYVRFRLPTIPKFRSPTLIFLLSFLIFCYWFFSQKSVFSFKSISVTTYIKNNFSKSVFVAFAHSWQQVRRDQTVSH